MRHVHLFFFFFAMSSKAVSSRSKSCPCITILKVLLDVWKEKCYLGWQSLAVPVPWINLWSGMLRSPMGWSGWTSNSSNMFLSGWHTNIHPLRHAAFLENVVCQALIMHALPAQHFWLLSTSFQK